MQRFKFTGLATFAVVCLIVLCGCVPREVLLPAVGLEVPVLRQFPPGFVVPVSNQTGELVTGFGGGGGGVTRTPVILVHGNTVAPRFWAKAYAYLLEQGYTKDEVWAVGYGWDTVRRFDSNDLSVPTIDAFVNSVLAYLSRKQGRPIRQVNIISHSLGVTLARQWMMQDNAWHRVRNFVGVAGANHGVWTAGADARGENRTVAFELYPGSPWLEQLNRGGETPGATRYMTLYDGTGWQDVLFPKKYKHSPALEGARNVAYNVENWAWYDHLELPREPATLKQMLAFFAEQPAPPAQAEPPSLMSEVVYWAYENGEARPVIRSTQAGAKVYCAAGGDYPAVSPETVGYTLPELKPGEVNTCFAYNAETGLASPMARFAPLPAHARLPDPQQIELAPPQLVHQNPFFIELEAQEPGNFIVYSTGGDAPTTGSPLYQAPIYIAGPVTLTAMTVAPDGRHSKPLRVEYDVSLDAVNRKHTLQRQLAPDTPAADKRSLQRQLQ